MVESMGNDKDSSNVGGHEIIMGFLGRQQNTWASYITKNAVGRPQHAELVGPDLILRLQSTPLLCTCSLCASISVIFMRMPPKHPVQNKK